MMRIGTVILVALGIASAYHAEPQRAREPADGAGSPGHAASVAPEGAPESLDASDWSGILEARDANRRAVAPLSGRQPFEDALTLGSLAQQAYVKASNTEEDDRFGEVVAVSGDTVVVGARQEDSAASGVNGDETDNSAAESGAVYVFVRDDSGWSQEAYLKASNTAEADGFGWSVAISGDTIAIGATGEDSSATRVNGDQSDNAAEDSGAVYVFVRGGTTWSQEAYLKASSSAAGAAFGNSVSVSGDTIVVGASGEDSRAGNNSGAAYVFVRSGTTWGQQAQLEASNAGGGDFFGHSVSVASETIVVGAPTEDSSASGVNGDQGNNGASASGAAYVFARSGGTWSQQAYLKASNTGSLDNFGGSVSVSGDTVVVGAQLEDSQATGVNGNQANDVATNSGAAYVFVRSGTSWSQQSYVKASNTGTDDHFGNSVSLSGEVLMVGAVSEDSSATGVGGSQAEGAPDSGAAYVFVRSGTTWSQQAYVKASNTETSDLLGISVSVSGCTLVAGAELEDSDATGVDGDQASDDAFNSGAAYVFGTPAAVAFRNAGANPASYTAGPIVIGGIFTATVDNNLASQVASLLFAFDTPISVTLAGGQTLLCLDLGSGELFTGGSLAPISSAGGVDTYSVAVPDDPGLCGFSFSSQAIQFGSPPFDLTNAQDLTVGGF